MHLIYAAAMFVLRAPLEQKRDEVVHVRIICREGRAATVKGVGVRPRARKRQLPAALRIVAHRRWLGPLRDPRRALEAK